MHRSYKVRKSCLEMASEVMACAPSLTMLAQEGAGLGKQQLPGNMGARSCWKLFYDCTSSFW
jgi:hypothetical protein